MRNSLIIITTFFFLYSCQTKTAKTTENDTASENTSRVAYFRAGNVHYYADDSSKISTIQNVTNPNFSPDGSELAYTESYDNDNKKAAADNRRIAVLNLNTNDKKIIKNNSPQCYGPVWSPDGSQLAFNVFDQDHWAIGVVDKSNTYRLIRPDSKTDYYGLSWTSDSKTILMHDFTTLFFIDTTNTVKRQLAIKEVTSDKSISSSTKFTLTDDNRFLIFNAENTNVSVCKEKNTPVYPVDALYKYDLQKKTITQLTPNDMYGYGYTIVNDIIYFSTTVKCGTNQPSIYTCDLSGKNINEFLKNATDVSVSK